MKELTPALIFELKSFLVERMVDNMETKDLVEYVTDDLDQYFESLPDEQFINEAKNYWDDSFDDVVEEIENMLIVISKRTGEKITLIVYQRAKTLMTMVAKLTHLWIAWV